jgi:hypothetical protein
MRCWLAGVLLAAVAAVVPSQATAANQETADRVAVALKRSGQLHNYRIAVLCHNGTVWLKGRVATQDQMNTALQVAFEAPEVGRVVNLLAVADGDASHIVSESSSGNSHVLATASETLPAVRTRDRADTLPKPVPVSVQPARIPRSQGLSTNPAQTATSSRQSWTPDIVISDLPTPLQADPTPATQPASWTKAYRMQAESARAPREGRAFSNGGRRESPKPASEQAE